MEVFAIVGFIFVLSAFATAQANSKQLRSLRSELEALQDEVELLGGERGS